MMNRIPLLSAALALSLLGAQVHASQVSAGFNSRTGSVDGKYHFDNVGSVIDSQDGDTPTVVELKSTDIGQDVYGTQFSLSGKAGAKQIDISAEASWQPLADPRIEIRSVNANIQGSTNGGERVFHEGRVRFRVDYDLFAPASDSHLYLSFYGVGRLGSGHTTSDDVWLTADGQDGDMHRTGTWYSDWLQFGDQDDIGDHSFSPSAISYGLNSDLSLYGTDNYVLPEAGSLNGYARATVSWEIVPIPEPETYALLGLGLAGLGVAKRLKKREMR